VPVDIADPIRSFRFHVSIQGRSLGIGDFALGFQKVSGLGASVGVFEWSELTDFVTPWKLPDRMHFPDVTFSRGVTYEVQSLWNWLERVEEVLAMTSSRPMRAPIEITAWAKGENSGPVAKWNVIAAWPKDIKFGDFDAETSSVQVLSMTVANEGVRFSYTGPPETIMAPSRGTAAMA